MKRNTPLCITIFLVFLMLMSQNTAQTTSSISSNPMSLASPMVFHSSGSQIPWWNSSFEYRVPINISEPNKVARNMWPVDVYVTFPQGHAYNGSLRVLYWDGGNWIGPLTLQVWNETFYSGTNYLKSATITFLVNVSKNAFTYYYLYYSDDDVGTISYTPLVTYEYLGANQYEFNGTTYSVQTVYSQGGKIGYIYSLITGDEIGTKGDGGDTSGCAHWNPDSSGLGSTTTTPYEVTGIIESGPIFIKYKTIAKFTASSTARSVIEYTFYWWGWITETNSSNTVDTDWSTYRNNEWVFDPYTMPKAYIVKEDGSNVNYTTIPSGTNIGHARYFTYYSDSTGNGIGTSNIELTWFNMSLTDYYHRIYYTSSYEFWDRYFYGVTNNPNCWIYERFAMIVWNATNPVAEFANLALANRHPLSIDVLEEDVIYRIRVIVSDGDNDFVSNAGVYLFNATSGAFMENKTSDNNGECLFYLFYPGNYKIYVNYTTTYIQNGMNIIIHNSTQITLTTADQGIIVNETIKLPMGRLTITVKDLLARSLGSDAYIEIFNGTVPLDNGKGSTVSGSITFEKLPFENYTIYTSYLPSNRPSEYWVSKITEDVVNFNSPLTLDITQPLGDLYVNVKTYSNEYLSSVSVSLYNKTFIHGQNHTLLTNSTGDVFFYRIENAKYNLTVSKVDSFGTLSYNSTIINKLNGSDSINTVIPLTYLNVYVNTTNGNPYTGVTVTIKKPNSNNILATATTNSSGECSFYWITSGYYNVTAKPPATPTPQSKVIYVGTNYTDEAVFTFAPVKYTPTYSTLINKNDTQIVSMKYNDSIVFTINFVNRTGTSDNYVDINITANIVFFEVYYNGSLIANISTPSTSITAGTTGIYYIHINTADLKMNVSTLSYEVRVGAYNVSYDLPERLYYYITVLTTETNHTLSATSLTVAWLDNITLSAWFYDTEHNTLIYGATVKCEIILGGQVVYSTQSVQSGPTYHININTTLNKLNSSDYTLVIYLEKQNYYTQTANIPLHINNAGTKLTVVSANVVGNWSSLVTLIVNYTLTNDIPIKNANVRVNNASYSHIVFLYDSTSHRYTVEINTSQFTPGVYILEIVGSLQNYETSYGYITLNVTNVPTNMTLVSSDVVDVAYGSVSNITITVYLTDILHNKNITDATVTYYIIETEKTGTFVVVNDVYSVNVSIENLLSGTYHIYITGSKANYSSQYTIVELHILPLSTTVKYPSEIVAKSNETITLAFEYLNGSNVFIGSAIGYVNWTENGVSLIRQQNRYVALIDTSLLPPGEYTLQVVLSAPGYENQIVYVKFTVLRKISYSAEEQYEEFWLRTLPINITLSDVYNNMAALSGANVTYQWFNETGTLTEIALGVYQLTLNLTKYQVGQYTLNISVEKAGYYGINFSITVEIKAVPTAFEEFVITPDSVEQGNTVQIRVRLIETLTNSGITDAVVTATIYRGSNVVDTITLVDVGDGYYEYNLTTSDFELANYLVRITAEKENYEAPDPVSQTLGVIEPGIFVPILGIRVTYTSLYFTIAVAVIASISLASVVIAVRHYKIPKDIRIFDGIIKGITKGKRVDPELLPDKEAMIKETLKEHFESYGLPVPSKKRIEEEL